MKKILILSFLFISFASQAQTDTTQTVKKDSLWYKAPFFRFYPIVMNNETTLYRGEAEKLFFPIPEAISQYRKYRNRSKVSLYSYAGLFVGAAVGMLGFENNKKGLSAAGITVSVYSFFSSILFKAMADANLRKAIKLYNTPNVKY